MKTTITKLTVILFISAFISSCSVDMFNKVEGNRNVISKKRKVGTDFTKVKVSTGLDLYIKQGNKTSLTIDADENLHDIIMTEVEGSTLKIYTEKNIWRAKSRKVYLTVTAVEGIKATSGSDVFSEGVIKATNLDLSTSSGADMRIEIEAENVTTKSSSGSGLRVKGTADNHESSASSGSSISAYGLKAKDVTAKASSGADISVYASESINARASSGGDIRYKGSPETIEKKSSSGGGISSRS